MQYKSSQISCQYIFLTSLRLESKEVAPAAGDREARKDLRLRRKDEERIKAAAKATGMRKVDFIVLASLREAEHVMNRYMSMLPVDAFAAFKNTAEAPPGYLPGLERLVQEAKGVLKDVEAASERRRSATINGRETSERATPDFWNRHSNEALHRFYEKLAEARNHFVEALRFRDDEDVESVNASIEWTLSPLSEAQEEAIATGRAF